MRLSRLLVWGMAATFGGTALLFIVFTYVPPMRGWVQEPAKIVASGLFTIVYLAVAMVCTVCAEHGRAPRLMRSGLIVDFLALLGQWGQVRTSCDQDLGVAGVGIEEFLDLLAHWGPCP